MKWLDEMVARSTEGEHLERARPPSAHRAQRRRPVRRAHPPSAAYRPRRRRPVRRAHSSRPAPRTTAL
ncbi:hypothetical protein, partial [Actinomyces massiliensis]|uniref:hypothetical protein n=1 Tax=Actinomyces massiliensis TaxID=461393 RepID=UPI0028ECB91B